ncbi:MAG: nucleoside 2-deoxyribosyltransferase [Rickettsiaceae bacterium]|nr:nucleoside 2-deoxyribosyltransferase [Rickettsiaceae bacterium]
MNYKKLLTCLAAFLIFITSSNITLAKEHKKKGKAQQKTIYFAGSLFNHKELIGNQYLAKAIETASNDRYKCILPQDIVHDSLDVQKIRDTNFKTIRNADGILVNFDGPELDSGTVTEFMTAKFLRKPAVVYRTDFRLAGDSTPENPWNLMLVNYPLTEKLSSRDVLPIYQRILAQDKSGQSVQMTSEKLSAHYATMIVAKLDKVFKDAEKNPLSDAEKKQITQWYNQSVGMSM